MRPAAASWWPTVVVGLVVVALLSWWTPDPGTQHRITWVEGRLGEAVDTPRMSVRATEVGFTRELVSPYGQPGVSSGEDVFVVVPLQVDVRQRVAYSEIDALTADGRWYAQRTEHRGNPQPAPPGWTSTGTAVFLVPTNRLEGLRLRITPNGREPVNHDVGISVDLLIGDAVGAVAQADAAGPLELPPSSLVVT